MATPQQEKPPVRLTIWKSTTKDAQNIVSTNAGLRGSLDDLDEYACRGNSDEPITRCGGRIFRTPVFRSKQDNSVPSEAHKSDGVKNQLAKENIAEQESIIIKAFTSWVEQKSVINRILFKWMGRLSNVTQTLSKWLSTTPEWSVWISQHLFADLHLAVEEDVIVYNSIQVFFIGENLPAFVLVLYGVTELSESSTTEQDEETAALEFSVQLARDLTTELHKYCCVDFLLLPCALPYKTFIEGVQTLEKNIELEQKESAWYYSGSQTIDTAGYAEVKEAALLLAGVSYVPYIMESSEPKESEDEIWLREFNPRWRLALSLLTEALGSTENATYTLTCSEDKYRTVEMTVLEAARRWAFSHDVILRVPTHSGLDLDTTENDLLHLTGKRKHTSYRMQIKKDGSALECGRYRGKSEAEHLQKKAEVPTSQGGQHLRRIFLRKEESKPPEDQTEQGQSLMSKNNTDGTDSVPSESKQTPRKGNIADAPNMEVVRESSEDTTMEQTIDKSGPSGEHEDDNDEASAEQPQIILPSGLKELRQELRLEKGKAQNLEALKNVIKDFKAYNPEEYTKVTTLQGSPIYFISPVFGCDTEDGKAEPPSNQLEKRYLTKKYEKHIMAIVKKWAGKAKRWSVWISNHLYVDFNLNVGDIERNCLQVFFVGEDKPPWMLTLYDPGYSVSDDSREEMEKRMYCFSKKIAEVLENQLRGCCRFDFTIVPLTLSKQQWTESDFKQNMAKMQRVAVHLTTGMYQHVKAAATTLTGVSYVPYILSKYKEEQTENFSEQKHLTLMERDWRAALSLMIEALSFQEGDCHITYTSDNEYKVKVAALEAARRWALTQDVVFVADDFLNNGYVQGHTELCYLSGDDDSERLQLSMQTPMEPHDSCAKYVFLDSDYLLAGAGLPSFSDIARKCESVASSVTSWGSKHRKHKVGFESSTGSKSKSSVDDDFPDLADVRVTQAELAVNMTGSQEPMEVTEETNAVSEIKPIEQSFAQMEVSSEQAECSAQMEVSAEQIESSEEKAKPLEHPEIDVCKERVKEWYPNLSEEAYFVPAVYMNRTQYKREKIAGQEVYVLQPLSQDSDARGDTANSTVLRFIKQLSRGQISGVPKQVMFVISQLEFRNYLNNMSMQSLTNALPRAVDEALKQQMKDEGDFDTLIIHRKFGVLACEIKAVGDNFAAINLPEAQQIKTIEKRISNAVKQLEKSRVVLKHLVSDYPTPPRIRVTLMVPNISVEQLGKVLRKYKQLREQLCGSLGIDITEDPIPKCFTSDDVRNLGEWWKQCMELDGADSTMTDELYLDLVARFGGPATTVTVPCSTVPCLAKAHRPVIRTLSEGVVETANSFAPADIILHPTQLDVIHRAASEPLVYLCGPPGTGKSLILILRALDWIQEKRKPVHVVITRDGNMAASHMLSQKLKEMTKQTDSGQQQGVAEPAENPWVRLHKLELPIYMKSAVEELAKLKSEGELFVIVDKAVDVFSSGNNEKTFHDFCTRLQERVGSGLHLWAAAMYHKLKPPNFKEVVLKTALRTPPSSTHHVMQHRAIVVLHDGPEHRDVKELHDCEECGRKVAEILNTLHVGKTARLSINSPQPPRWRDVLLLTWDSYFHDKITGKKARPASGLIRGLRQKGFPVTVLETGDADAVGAVGTMSGSDEIVAAGSRFIQGLERKIVVYVETAQPAYYDLDWARLCSMSRCTSQLIHVKPPDRPPTSQQKPAAVNPQTSGDVE